MKIRNLKRIHSDDSSNDSEDWSGLLDISSENGEMYSVADIMQNVGNNEDEEEIEGGGEEESNHNESEEDMEDSDVSSDSYDSEDSDVAENSSVSDENSSENSDDYTGCTCRRCLVKKELRDYPYVYPDNRNTKFDVYHFGHFLFKLANVVDLPVSMKFFPKLIKKIKDKMKFGLQETLMKLLYFPGHGHLPHTVVLQIVEILLESAIAAGDREFVKFEENSPDLIKALSGAYGCFEETHDAISAQWPPYFASLKLPGECAVIIKLNRWIAGNILFLLDYVKVLVPEFSFEEGQYEKFVADINVQTIRKHVRGVMRCNKKQTLGPKERQNLTSYIYALRRTYDHTADILTPHVKMKDIVTMCKIYKSSA